MNWRGKEVKKNGIPEWETVDMSRFEGYLSFKWNIIELTKWENIKYQTCGQKGQIIKCQVSELKTNMT